MILDLPLTDVVILDISLNLVKNQERLNGLDVSRQHEIHQRHFHLKDEGPDVSKVRRIQSVTWVGGYTPIQMKYWAPIDEADPLEEYSPCLTILQVDSKEAAALVSYIIDRACGEIKCYSL